MATVAEQITEQLAFRIASGAYAPGTKLPSVRGLAREHSINPSTVQVVMGRLQAAGFFEAHQGLGFLVRDIWLQGGIETWRYLFRFAQQLPDLAIKIFEDILTTRRTLVASALRAIAADPRRVDSAPVRRAIDQYELLVSSGNDDLTQLARAELQALRTIIAAADQGVALAVFNSVSEMMIEVPEVVRALHANPDLKVLAWRTLLDSWDAGELSDLSDERIANLEAALLAWDASTVQRFTDAIKSSR